MTRIIAGVFAVLVLAVATGACTDEDSASSANGDDASDFCRQATSALTAATDGDALGDPMELVGELDAVDSSQLSSDERQEFEDAVDELRSEVDRFINAESSEGFSLLRVEQAVESTCPSYDSTGISVVP